MSSQIQIKRKINGTGSPAAAGAKEGELAIAFPGAAGVGTDAELWAFDSSAWRRVNPTTTITTQSITLGTVGANIGAAYTTWSGTPGNTITGNVVIASWGTPQQAYVLTNTALPGAAASWTSLGGSTPFATSGEVLTGTEAAKAIAPDVLRASTVNTSAGAGDANKIPRLDATGKIAASMLPTSSWELKGALDQTGANSGPAAPTTGDTYFLTANGNFDASWTGLGGTNGLSGDMVVWDGAKWLHIPNYTDLNAYVPLAGSSLLTGTFTWVGAAGSKAGTILYDFKGGTLDGALIDAGTY
jgi:hypothetical protein